MQEGRESPTSEERRRQSVPGLREGTRALPALPRGELGRIVQAQRSTYLCPAVRGGSSRAGGRARVTGRARRLPRARCPPRSSPPLRSRSCAPAPGRAASRCRGAEAALAADPRAGARTVLAAVAPPAQANRAEGQRLRQLLRYEVELWERGVTLVAGVDEAGMAPLAGPVVAAACILPRDYRPRGVDDSKQLDAAERERLAAEIKAHAVAWAVGRAEVEEIDTLNIYRAGILLAAPGRRGARPAPRAPAGRRAPLPRARHPAGRHREGRRARACPSPPPASSPRPPATR